MMTNCIRTLAVVIACSVSAGGCAVHHSTPAKTGAELVEFEAELIEIEATVSQLDKANRTVTLTGPEGNSITLNAGDEVRNFDQLALGDQVDAEYFESIAVFLAKADGAEPNTNAQVDVELAPVGDKPGITEVAAIEVQANVEAIDRENRLVTLKGPEGRTVTHHVIDESIDLSNVNVGDQVVVQVTQSLMVSVNSK